MLRRLPNLIFVVTLLAGAVNASAQPACVHLFVQAKAVDDRLLADQQLTEALTEFTDLMNDGSTTGLRKEDKYVVSKATVEGLLRDLEASFGAKFQLRDKKLEGRKNVTVTKYLRPIAFFGEGGDLLSAKIRFRRYLTADASLPLSKETMEPVEFVRNHQFVEIKIDHPDHRQVVVKPRILMSDADIDLLQSRAGFASHRAELAARARALNPKVSPEVIEQILKVFESAHRVSPSVRLPEFSETTYVRDSYSAMLIDRNGASVEVQFTIDQEISVVDLQSGQRSSAYETDDAVIEIKVPLARAEISRQDLLDVPGLATVAIAKKLLQAAHDDRFKPGAGKLSTFRRWRAKHAEARTVVR